MDSRALYLAGVMLTWVILFWGAWIYCANSCIGYICSNISEHIELLVIQ